MGFELMAAITSNKQSRRTFFTQCVQNGELATALDVEEIGIKCQVLTGEKNGRVNW